ncbi:MAG: hypothetical protein ACLF0P_07445 [Thermoanaerobaculia bacterium]
MSLTIPGRYQAGFAALLAYDDDQLQELSRKIAESGFAPSPRQLASKIAEETSLYGSELISILDALTSLYGVLNERDTAAEELVADIKDALARKKGEDSRLDPDQGNWPAVKTFLQQVLSPEGPLAVTAKAAVVRQDAERFYCTAKTLSDLRPVFHYEDRPPAALLATHTLQIAYHRLADFDLDTFSVTMTERHLLNLRDTIDRALRKHQQLRQFAQASGTPFLEDETRE